MQTASKIPVRRTNIESTSTNNNSRSVSPMSVNSMSRTTSTGSNESTNSTTNSSTSSKIRLDQCNARVDALDQLVTQLYVNRAFMLNDILQTLQLAGNQNYNSSFLGDRDQLQQSFNDTVHALTLRDVDIQTQLKQHNQQHFSTNNNMYMH